MGKFTHILVGGEHAGEKVCAIKRSEKEKELPRPGRGKSYVKLGSGGVILVETTNMRRIKAKK